MLTPTRNLFSKAAIICLLFLFSARSLAQTEDRTIGAPNTFLQEIGEINDLLTYYNTLSPFSEDEKEVDQIDSLNLLIFDGLLSVLNDPRIVQYPIEKLFPGDGMVISKSEDNRLFFFTVDEKTGGSYRTQFCIMHYQFSNGSVIAKYFGEMSSGPVYLLDSLKSQYFVLGSAQTCNTCIAAAACTIQFDSASYFTDNFFKYDGRNEDLTRFEYESIKKVFTYAYEAPDRDDPIYGGNKGFASRRKFKRTYKYVDGVFVEGPFQSDDDAPNGNDR